MERPSAGSGVPSVPYTSAPQRPHRASGGEVDLDDTTPALSPHAGRAGEHPVDVEAPIERRRRVEVVGPDVADDGPA